MSTSLTGHVGLMWSAAAIIFVLAIAFVPGTVGLLRSVTLTDRSLARRFLGPAIGVVGYVALFVWAQHLVRLYAAVHYDVAFLSFSSGLAAGVVYNFAALVGLVLGWKQVDPQR